MMTAEPDVEEEAKDGYERTPPFHTTRRVEGARAQDGASVTVTLSRRW